MFSSSFHKIIGFNISKMFKTSNLVLKVGPELHNSLHVAISGRIEAKQELRSHSRTKLISHNTTWMPLLWTAHDSSSAVFSPPLWQLTALKSYTFSLSEYPHYILQRHKKLGFVQQPTFTMLFSRRHQALFIITAKLIFLPSVLLLQKFNRYRFFSQDTQNHQFRIGLIVRQSR